MRTLTRRWVVLASVAIVTLVSIGLGSRYLDANRYRDQIAAQIENVTGGDVTIGAVSLGLGAGLVATADNVTIAGSDLLPGVLCVAQIHLDLALIPLLTGKVLVNQLQLVRPSIAFQAAPLKSRSERTRTPRTGKPSSLEIEVRQIRAVDGRATLQRSAADAGSGAALTLSDIAVKIENMAAGKESAIDASATVTLGSAPPFVADWEGSLVGWTENLALRDASLRLDGRADGASVAAMLGALPTASAVPGLSGTISVAVSLESDLGQQASVSAKAHFSGISYENTALWRTPPSLSDATLELKLDLDGHEGKVTQVTVDFLDQEVSASGRIPDLRNPAAVGDLVLNSRVELSKVAPLVPWVWLGEDFGNLRPVLESGGLLEIKNARLASIDLSEIDDARVGFLSRAVVPATISGLSFDPGHGLPEIRKIAANLVLEGNQLTATGVSASVGPLTLPAITARLSDVAGNAKLSAEAHGTLKLASSHDVDKLLQSHGLQTLDGEALVDFRLNHDSTRSTPWTVNGSLALSDVEIETYPGADRIEGGNGKLTVTLSDFLDVSVETFRGRLNGSAFHVDGTARRLGTESMLVNGSIKTSDLDLARLAAFAPLLRNTALQGKSDIDLRLDYARAHPEATRAAGTVRARNVAFDLAAQGLRVDDLDTDLEVRKDDSVLIKSFSVSINGQALAVSGNLQSPTAPQGRLTLRASDLDIDRLIGSKNRSAGKSSEDRVVEPPRASTGRPTGRRTVPPWLLDATLAIDVAVANGQYRTIPFSNLELKADYRHGRVSKHRFQVDLGGGNVTSSGTLDLNTASEVKFDVQPTAKGVNVSDVLTLLDREDGIDHGVFDVAGDISGTAGSMETMIRSLDGKILVRSGPGRLTTASFTGRALLNLLTFIHIKGVLEGDLARQTRNAGIPYDSLEAQMTASGGLVTVHSLHIETPALSAVGSGTVDTSDMTIHANAAISMLTTVDEILGLVPVVGKGASDLTKLRVRIHGPLRSPHFRLSPAATVTDAIKGESRQLSEDLEKGFKTLRSRF